MEYVYEIWHLEYKKCVYSRVANDWKNYSDIR
jgi:hypothetical protein